MYIMKTFRRKKLADKFAINELIGMQYFTDKEYKKAKEIKEYMSTYYKEHELPLIVELQRLEV